VTVLGRGEQAGWLLGHPFAAVDGRWFVAGRHDGVRQSGRSGSIRQRDRAADGGHDLHDLATDQKL